MCFLQVHAFSVCDDPDYFHNFAQGLLDGLNAGVNSRDIVHILNVSVLVFFLVGKIYKDSLEKVIKDATFLGLAVFGFYVLFKLDNTLFRGENNTD